MSRTDRLPVGPALKRPLLVGDAPASNHLGEPPVHHLDFAEVAHHDIRRLEVAVDDAATMRIGHRLAHLLEDREIPRPVLAQRPPVSFKEGGQGNGPGSVSWRCKAARRGAGPSS